MNSIFTCSLLFVSSALAFSCLDQLGKPVDYFVALKHNSGYNYSTYVPATKSFGYDEFLSPYGGHVANTLQQLYRNSDSTKNAWLFANDETPKMVQSSTKAHLKTVLAIGPKTGFWLIHSVPRFPITTATYNSSGYDFPSNEIKYGQTFMCLTLDLATFETVGQALFIDQPHLYDVNMPYYMRNTLPTMTQVMQGKYASGSQAKTFAIKTSGGKHFTIFAKNRAWGQELYGDFVAPYYKDSLLVESWLNGRGKLPGVCHPFSVLNVEHINMPDGTSWKETQDHSKWAITRRRKVSCVGDINRQHGQLVRGGGTYCTADSALWTAFKSIISAYNKTCV